MREVTPDQLKLIRSKSVSKLSNASITSFRDKMSLAQNKMYDRLVYKYNSSVVAYSSAAADRDRGRSITDQKLGTLCTIALENCDKWISFCEANDIAPPILPQAIKIRNKLSWLLKQDNFKKYRLRSLQ